MPRLESPSKNVDWFGRRADQDGGRRSTWQSQSLTEFTGGRFRLRDRAALGEKRNSVLKRTVIDPRRRESYKGEDVEIEVQLVREIWAGVVRLPNGSAGGEGQLAVAVVDQRDQSRVEHAVVQRARREAAEDRRDR